MAQSYLQSQLEDRGAEGGRGRATVTQNTWELLDTNRVVFFPHYGTQLWQSRVQHLAQGHNGGNLCV